MIRIQLNFSHYTCKIWLNRKNIDFFFLIYIPMNRIWQRCKTFKLPLHSTDEYSKQASRFLSVERLGCFVNSLSLFFPNFSWFDFSCCGLFFIIVESVTVKIYYEWYQNMWSLEWLSFYFFSCTYFGFYLNKKKNTISTLLYQFTPSTWVFPFIYVFPYV